MRFRFDPLSRVFSNFQIDVFSMKTLGREVWTEGMTHRNVCVFKRKPISGRGIRITANDIIIQYNTILYSRDKN